ncbi:hypothetical protein GLV88_02370 [Staphylococcus hyicus]|uniref:hypothetical protein n=1 Tax=Staphylococcus hyicus TaxID=1284 RepID=UPI0014307801|nr:hypothetical protein [Staphylococcus hyicus]NJH99306.1 hypothetical protein [Staphylococcus hyicus]NJI30155.1 hypothetical protein [Staphylococcus hyicus]
MMRKYSKYTVPLIIVSTMSLGVMAPSIDAKVTPSSAEPTQVTTAKANVQLTQQQKVALAYYIQGYNQYTFTRSEIQKGKYTVQWMNGEKHVYPLKQITLVKQPKQIDNVETMKGAPKDMVFYQVLPAKGNFATIVGVSHSQVVIGGTQSASSYKDFLKGAKVQNISTLYQQYHKDAMFQQIANKMVITTTFPK